MPVGRVNFTQTHNDLLERFALVLAQLFEIVTLLVDFARVILLNEPWVISMIAVKRLLLALLVLDAVLVVRLVQTLLIELLLLVQLEIFASVHWSHE